VVGDGILDDLQELHRGLGGGDAVLVQQLHHQPCQKNPLFKETSQNRLDRTE
jgi:hypothetical protein